MAGTFLKTLLKGLSDVVLSKVSVLAVLLVVVAYYSYNYGNEFGPYAQAYKGVVAELKAKNEILEKQKAEDEAAIAKADKERDAALASLANLKTCKATKAQAKAINSVKE